MWSTDKAYVHAPEHPLVPLDPGFIGLVTQRMSVFHWLEGSYDTVRTLATVASQVVRPTFCFVKALLFLLCIIVDVNQKKLLYKPPAAWYVRELLH